MTMIQLRDSSDPREEMPWKGTDGAGHVYGLARNMIKRVPADGAYIATETHGIFVAIVPNADDTEITPVGGSQDNAVVKELFTAGEPFPIHATSVTVGANGMFYLIIPDA